MRDIAPGLQAAFAREASTIAVCWQLIRADGVAIGLTSHDCDIWVDGCRYRASPGLLPAAAITPDPTNPASTETSGALSDSAISRRDLIAGRYEGTVARCFILDWASPELGLFVLRSGTIGAVSINGAEFNAELVSPLETLRQSQFERFSPECRASLGDDRCMIDPALHSTERTIYGVLDGGVLEVDRSLGDVDAFRYGVVRFLTGEGCGLDRQIAWSDGVQLGVSSLPPAVAPGDRLALRAGCDRRLVTCQDRFANALNFRGEPFVPGFDAMSFYPGLA